MNWQELIKNKDVLRIIEENKDQNVASLALKWASKKDPFTPFILNQIQGRQIAERKIPFWIHYDLIIYPDKTALEQCSSELTAKFKSQLVKGLKVADLTGGMGVDSYFISREASQHFYVEPNEHRFEIAKHNFEVLGVKNTSFVNTNAEEFLKHPVIPSLDCIYIDPSRRNEHQKRAFLLKDMQPDLSLIMDHFQTLKKKMIIKLSPMLDIKAAIKELKNVKIVYVISIEDECKELLFEIDFDYHEDPNLYCVNFAKENQQDFTFNLNQEDETSLKFSPVLKYIYDPFSSLNKSGGFKSLANKFSIDKISHNTHLYTSDNIINNFFGNCFEVITVNDFSSKEFSSLDNKKGVIKIRNFRLTQSEIEKKTKITYGPEFFYFFFTDSENHLKVATTKKVY